ncbi:ABC transporter ATP-binding protein/permease [Rhodovulum steppense]|uniref:Putative ATP-binding cassette transporter n=1 Tax=Rhodovulum steppense TaxID=540251 RepID=A0A4R1YIX8_9RHOB|nr:SbmA/BacA-like family transporter [Rhodovulum steppense]TCM76557.1 putative ATP-binding cassette transporter [Rhodovulum steppense]
MSTLAVLGATLARAGRLARLAASGPGRWRGGALYATVLALNFLGVWISIRLIAWNKAFFDALEALDGAAALAQVWVFFLLVGASAAAWLAADWLRKRLLILWRARLTALALDLWLGTRAYWQLRPGFGAHPVENPDQRVAEDCRKFVEGLLEFTLELISKIVALVSFFAVLWSLSGFGLAFTLFGIEITIPRYMVWLAPLYVALATGLTHALGRPLKGLYFARERCEADFRHALVQLRETADSVVRETADSVALSRGEAAERRRLDGRFAGVVTNWRAIMRAELIQGLFTRPYFQTVLRVPTFFALPAYFAGQVTLGGLMQLASAFSQVTTTLSWFIFSYRDLAAFVAVCERLDGLLQAARAPAPLPGAPQAIRRDASSDGALHLDGVRLATPEGRWLDPVPDRAIPPGARVLISGASGQGKTTLLAAIGGLWCWGEGRIARPGGRWLMLPAGAPIFTGGLMEAACYPDDPARHDPARIAAVLTRLGLGHRLAAAGRADELSGLSLGERQRLGLARAALLRPDWLVLDEATAAMDTALEADLMAWLVAELPATAFLIVAHRAPVGLPLDDILPVGPTADSERRTA